MNSKSGLTERLLQVSSFEDDNNNVLQRLNEDDDDDPTESTNKKTEVLGIIPKLKFTGSSEENNSSDRTSTYENLNSPRATIQVICPGYKIAIRSKPDPQSRIRKVIETQEIIEVFAKTKNGYYELCDHSGYINKNTKNAQLIIISSETNGHWQSTDSTPRSYDSTTKTATKKSSSRHSSPLTRKFDDSTNDNSSLQIPALLPVPVAKLQRSAREKAKQMKASEKSTNDSEYAEYDSSRVSNRYRSLSNIEQSETVKKVMDDFKTARDALMEARKQLKFQKFMRLLACGVALMVTGALVSVVLLTLAFIADVGPDKKSITNNNLVLVGVLGGLVAAFGFLIVTCALSDDFDLDEYHRDSNLSMGGPFLISTVAFMFSLLPPFFSVLVLPVGVSFFKSNYKLLDKDCKVPLTSIYRYDLPSYKFILIIFITFVSINLYFCWSVLENAYPSLKDVYFITPIPIQELFPSGVATSVPYMNIVLFNFVSLVSSIKRYWSKHQMYLSNPDESAFFNSTMFVTHTSHCVFFNLGFSFILLGLMGAYLDDFYGDTDAYSFVTGTVSGYTWIMLGFEISVASFLAMVYSPKTLFNFMMGYIGEFSYKDLEKKAGSYISRTLNDVKSVKDDPWFIHCGTIEVNGEKHFLPERNLVNSKDKTIVDARRNWYRGTITEVTDKSLTVVLEPTPETMEKRVTIVHFPRVDMSDLSPEELDSLAKENLRFVKWDDILSQDKEIFKRSVRDETGPPKVDYYEKLAKKLAPGQVIDFFISHSWDDDAVWKLKVLTEVVRKFKLKHGRDPTFWFDKVCIDQTNLSNGLRVLPINLMACRKMLVLIGKSYPRKIWCAWELYVRMLYTASANEAIESMDIYTEDKNTVRKLLQFDVSKAYAYDPNEQLKLRTVIKSFEKEFNDRIFDLAKLMITNAAIEGKV